VGVPVSFVDGCRVLREGAADEVRGLRGDVLSELGRDLQRSTRSLRLANLSLLGSRASISSTQSRSYFLSNFWMTKMNINRTANWT
jgi:hypothetical protein